MQNLNSRFPLPPLAPQIPTNVLRNHCKVIGPATEAANLISFLHFLMSIPKTFLSRKHVMNNRSILEISSMESVRVQTNKQILK